MKTVRHANIGSCYRYCLSEQSRRSEIYQEYHCSQFRDVDEELHSKQLRIVAKSLNLNLHKFVRAGLEIKLMYIFDIIEAMASVANELWHNTTDNG